MAVKCRCILIVQLYNTTLSVVSLSCFEGLFLLWIVFSEMLPSRALFNWSLGDNRDSYKLRLNQKITLQAKENKIMSWKMFYTAERNWVGYNSLWFYHCKWHLSFLLGVIWTSWAVGCHTGSLTRSWGASQSSSLTRVIFLVMYQEPYKWPMSFNTWAPLYFQGTCRQQDTRIGSPPQCTVTT